MLKNLPSWLTMKAPETPWPCSWEAHELEQLRHGRRMTFRQKLVWLEDATEFVRQMQAARTALISPGAESRKKS
jgi:hypothetical protein